MSWQISFIGLFEGNIQTDDNIFNWPLTEVTAFKNYLKNLEDKLSGDFTLVEIANYTHPIYNNNDVCFTFKKLNITVTEGIFGWYNCGDIEDSSFSNINSIGTPIAYIMKPFQNITNLETTKLLKLMNTKSNNEPIHAKCDYEFQLAGGFDNNTKMIIGIVVGGILFVLLLLCVSLWAGLPIRQIYKRSKATKHRLKQLERIISVHAEGADQQRQSQQKLSHQNRPLPDRPLSDATSHASTYVIPRVDRPLPERPLTMKSTIKEIDSQYSEPEVGTGLESEPEHIYDIT